MTWMKKLTRTLRRTRSRDDANLFASIDLPYTESKNYRVILESIRNPATPSGYDWQYGVVNRITGVLEFRVNSLAVAVLVMQNQEQQLSKVITGELNGYNGPIVATPPPSKPGSVPL